MQRLTRRQEDVLLYIVDETAETGFTPTLHEIADHFGWSSANAAADHVSTLVRKGWISRKHHQLKINGACPLCRRITDAKPSEH